MNNVVSLAPSRDEWIRRCKVQLMHLGPLLWDEFAEELALDIYRAWPALVPEVAAKAYLMQDREAA